MEAEVSQAGPRATKCGWPLEPEKVRRHSLLELAGKKATLLTVSGLLASRTIGYSVKS